jgi:hypothetical protein
VIYSQFSYRVSEEYCLGRILYIIDNQMTGMPSFRCMELDIGNKHLEFHSCHALKYTGA